MPRRILNAVRLFPFPAVAVMCLISAIIKIIFRRVSWEKYMKRAIELAKEASAEGEVPVGAVVVKKTTGEIVGEGRNQA